MEIIKNFDEFGLNESTDKTPDYLRSIKKIQKGKPETYELASSVIGDGLEPNMFFVTISNDYMYYDKKTEDYVYYFSSTEAVDKAPVEIEKDLTTEIFGPFETIKQVQDKLKDIELNEEVGPRSVVVEDRISGEIYQKYMQAVEKVIWSEEVSGELK